MLRCPRDPCTKARPFPALTEPTTTLPSNVTSSATPPDHVHGTHNTTMATVEPIATPLPTTGTGTTSSGVTSGVTTPGHIHGSHNTTTTTNVTTVAPNTTPLPTAGTGTTSSDVTSGVTTPGQIHGGHNLTTAPNVTTVAPNTTPLPTTTTSPSWTILPPIQDQICLQAGIKKPFYSILGNHYCQHTCLFRPMDECNLYLCYCNTSYFSTKYF